MRLARAKKSRTVEKIAKLWDDVLELLGKGRPAVPINIEKLKEELEFEEKFVREAYQDHLGYWTIGIGRLIDKRKGGGITREEAFYLLENDIGRALVRLRAELPWFSGLSDARQRALTNMAFQMGVDGLLGFKTTLALMQAGRFDEAAEQALKSKWAQQTPARAKRVTDMIRNG